MSIFKFKSSATATHLILVSLFGLLSFACEAAPVYSASYCTEGSYFRPNTTFQSTLNTLLSSLVSNATLHDGYYRTNMPLGAPNDLKGLFLCRGDTTPSACQQCVAAAANNITRLCTNQTVSFIWYDECMVRYSNDTYLNNIVPAFNLDNKENVSDSESTRFSEFLASTLNSIAQEAMNSASGKKFATKEADFTSSMKLYSLAQCTPDLSTSECNTCFQSAISSLGNCCVRKRGARSLLPGCNIRFELYPFYNVSAVSTRPNHPSPSSGIKKRTKI